MPNGSSNNSNPPIGLIGFGAFGQLIAEHIRPHFRMYAYDPASGLQPAAERCGITLTSLEKAARCSIMVLATPVGHLEAVVDAVAPHVQRGSLILDVGSVKVKPAEIMKRGLPDHADIVATHPLFGPQSARNGLAGLNIALCPIRGRRSSRLAAFLRSKLRLNVIMTTPEDHDREVATVQGLTHLIAKVLLQMEPLPARMTTRSFDLLMAAVHMVHNDAPEVFEAIERSNPYSSAVRKRFLELASALNAKLHTPAHRSAYTAFSPEQASTGTAETEPLVSFTNSEHGRLL
jgi:prephenate dehydrogenase